jgi:hypothetical protein
MRRGSESRKRVTPMPPVGKPDSALPPVEMPTEKAELHIVFLEDNGRMTFYNNKKPGIITRIVRRLFGSLRQ